MVGDLKNRLAECTHIIQQHNEKNKKKQEMRIGVSVEIEDR